MIKITTLLLVLPILVSIARRIPYKERTLILSGTGDVVEPDEGVAAIGSGGPYAQAAAIALLKHSQLGARQIAEESLLIAGRICIYTNDQISIEEL